MLRRWLWTLMSTPGPRNQWNFSCAAAEAELWAATKKNMELLAAAPTAEIEVLLMQRIP